MTSVYHITGTTAVIESFMMPIMRFIFDTVTELLTKYV